MGLGTGFDLPGKASPIFFLYLAVEQTVNDEDEGSLQAVDDGE